MAVELRHLEGEVLIVQPFMLLWEVALDLQQQSCQRVGIAFHILKRIIVKIQDLEEITQQRRV